MTEATTNTELRGTAQVRPLLGHLGNLALFTAGLLALWLAVSQRSCLDSHFGTELASGERAGDLIHGRGTVLYRPGGSFSWRDLSGGSVEVSRGAVIFVGPNSSARLNLEEGGIVVDIMPNTLLELGKWDLNVGWNDFLTPFFKPRPTIAFRLQKGVVTVLLQTDARGLRIRNNGQDYEIVPPSKKAPEAAIVVLHVEEVGGGGVLKWEVQGGASVAALNPRPPVPVPATPPPAKEIPAQSEPRKRPAIGLPRLLPPRIE